MSDALTATSLVSAGSRGSGPHGARRWGFALALALTLHAAAAAWFLTRRDHAVVDAVKPPVEVALLQPQRIAREARPARPANPPAGAARAGAAHGRALEAIPTRAARPARAAPSAETATTAARATQSASASPASGAASASASASASAPAETGVRFSVPPSGDLHYNTFYNGVQNQPGTIHWTSDDDGYDMLVTVPLPFVGTFSYESRGRIDAFGLAPQRYSEKRGRRPEDVTTFDRAGRQIAFSRTNAARALPDGAQDRFSMIMQLASLVRGAPEAYTPGVTRSFFVADNDSAETWPIETIGDESVQTPDGFVAARHFMRLPRHEGDRRRIDVWLAPSLGWLPARIVQTEPNGAQIELLWRGKLAVPGAENADQSMQTPDGSSVSAPREQP